MNVNEGLQRFEQSKAQPLVGIRKSIIGTTLNLSLEILYQNEKMFL